MTSVTQSDQEELLHEEELELPRVQNTASPIYAKVVKKRREEREPLRQQRDCRNSSRRHSEKKEVSFVDGSQATADQRHFYEEHASDSEMDRSFPSHRPPSHGQSSRRTQSLDLHSLNLSNLPVYSLNQTLPLATGDHAYLLTRRGPDGREETFTATVITPTPSPSPPKSLGHRSSSIPILTTPSPLQPLSTSTPKEHRFEQQPRVGTGSLYDYNIRGYEDTDTVHDHRSTTGPMVRKKKSLHPQKLNHSTQTAEDQQRYCKYMLV